MKARLEVFQNESRREVLAIKAKQDKLTSVINDFMWKYDGLKRLAGLLTETK
jgi:hypothetical protein